MPLRVSTMVKLSSPWAIDPSSPELAFAFFGSLCFPLTRQKR